MGSNLFPRGDNRFNDVTRLKTFMELSSGTITNRVELSGFVASPAGLQNRA
jgi:hypothetical protein